MTERGTREGIDVNRLVRCAWCRKPTEGGFVWRRHPDAVCCSLDCVNNAEQSAARASATIDACPACGAVNEGRPPYGSWRDADGGCKACRRREIYSANTRQETLEANIEKLSKRYESLSYSDKQAQDRADKA